MSVPSRKARDLLDAFTDPFHGQGEHDPHDGAVHIIGVDHLPLCGRSVQSCYAVTRLYGPQPDPGVGCWTCMEKRHAMTGEGWKP